MMWRQLVSFLENLHQLVYRDAATSGKKDGGTVEALKITIVHPGCISNQHS